MEPESAVPGAINERKSNPAVLGGNTARNSAGDRSNLCTVL